MLPLNKLLLHCDRLTPASLRKPPFQDSLLRAFHLHLFINKQWTSPVAHRQILCPVLCRFCIHLGAVKFPAWEVIRLFSNIIRKVMLPFIRDLFLITKEEVYSSLCPAIRHALVVREYGYLPDRLLLTSPDLINSFLQAFVLRRLHLTILLFIELLCRHRVKPLLQLKLFW